MIEDVTGIVVCYNTASLMKRAYESIRKFHPQMPIIIIDGSDKNNSCANYCKSLASNITRIIYLGYNIGHGRGMHLGINKTSTKYALILDSDIEMLASPIQAMLEMMEKDTFGVGKVGAINVKDPESKHILNVPYLHPYFQLINIENYKKFPPYIHHGAPCIRTMLAIKKRGLSEKILKDFPDRDKYVKHYHRGTRYERMRLGQPEFDGGWERI